MEKDNATTDLAKAGAMAPVMAFKTPNRSVGALDAEAAASVITAASDIALVVDRRGVIRDVSVNNEDLSRELAGGEAWHGRKWADTVTEESRPKVEALIGETADGVAPRWRHVNHIAPPSGGSVPILYSAVRLGAPDRTVLIGRDLRPVSALQQRLVEAQQSVERDYARLRQAETRYRLLFQVSPEPVLIVDAPGGRVVEMNPAATRLFGKSARRITGRPLVDAFMGDSADAVGALLAGLRAGGSLEEVRATLSEGGRLVVVSASLMRQEGGVSCLVRLSPVNPESEALALPPPRSKLLQVVERVPDAFAVTDGDGRLITANDAFLELAQLPGEDAAVGQPLDSWLGRPGVEMGVLLGTLRQSGAVRLFGTTLRGAQGATANVEVSAVSVSDAGGRPCFGFAIRDVSMRVSAAPRAEPLRSVEQLTQLIGRVPLKDLVREATDVIERLCIEAALQLTGDNRASAAEMLGLSRQSLYVKLRRYGLGDLGSDTDELPGP
jgi:transcriptional regulator PpsR